MKKILSLLLVLFVASIAIAQNKKQLDAFEKDVNMLPADTHKVTMLNALGNEYMTSKPKKSVKFFEQAQKLAVQLNDMPGLALSYYNLSNAYTATGQKGPAADAKRLYNETKEKIKDKQQIADLSSQVTTANSELKDKMNKLTQKERDLLSQEAELRMLDTVLDQTQREKADLDKALAMSKMELKIKEDEAKMREQERLIELEQEKAVRNLFIAGFVLVLIVTFFIYRGFREKQKTNAELSEKNNLIAKEKERSEELLLNILPAETADELKKFGKASPRYYSEVTVLFTDFKNFTRFAEKLTPDQLVAEIDFCFRKFDEIVERHGLEKIKTIGDAYMCASGVPVENSNNATAVVDAALEIRDFMKDMRAERRAKGEDYWEIRIGVNTGPIIAGIVGIRKFAYDIWGDTVNIAARMESSGEAGKINISGTTYELVKDKFACVYRGKVEAKNKGEIEMYFVESRAEKAPEPVFKVPDPNIIINN